VTEDQIHRALRHPLRRRILAVLWKFKGSMSPSEISELLGVRLSNVSYHVRLLRRETGIITLADSQPVRGSIQHFYDLNRQNLAARPWAVELIEETEVPLPIPQPRQPPDEEMFNRYAENLTPQEKCVVDGCPRTGRDAIAREIDSTVEQVRLIERVALRKIERARYEDEQGGG
jgi:DNA-binding transcriptional ArsR family regulator